MDDLFSRLWEHWENLMGRRGGPLGFRFILQPVMSVLLAVRDGRKDAKSGRPAYLAAILAGKEARWPLLREGLTSVLRVLVLGLAMDAIYQVMVFKRFYPLEAAVVTLTLAFVPYLLVRGPVNRVARHLRPPPAPAAPREREKTGMK